MKSEVVWKGGMAFTGTSDSGYLIPLDAKKAAGGHELGFRPLQLFAVGLAGCTGMDVISILKKKRQEVTEFSVSTEVERAEKHPRVFTKILIEYNVTGKNLEIEAVERAVELSEKKYCGAMAMLRETAEITHSINVMEAD